MRGLKINYQASIFIITAGLLWMLVSCNTQRKLITASSEKFNHVYVDLPNPILLSIDVKKKRYSFESSNGSVIRWQNKVFITPDSLGHVTLKIIDHIGKWEHSFRFKVLQNTTPIYAYLCRDHTLDSFRWSNVQCIALFYDVDYDIEVKVTTFVCSIKKNNSVVEITNKSSYFSDSLRTELKQLTAGDEVTFKEIFVQFPNKKITQAQPFTITVK